MGSSFDPNEILKEDMDRIRIEKPHVGTLLDAFGPVLLIEHTLQEKITGRRLSLPPDKLKTLGGIPLIKEQAILFPDDPWQDLTIAVAGAIHDGFPHLAENMDRLTLFLQRNPVKLSELFLPYELPLTNEAPAWTAEIQIEPAALILLINTVKRIILTARAATLKDKLTALPWSKGYCPFCGSFPILAFLRVNGQRWLHCGCCHHEWTYPRPQCPWCEHESPEDTTYLYIEGDKESSAFLCETCRRYLVTVTRQENLREIDPDLTALSLTHLDIILQEKGYTPMAESAWNTL